MSLVLVTGAAGHLGGAIVRRLAAEGHEVACWMRTPGGTALPRGCRVAIGDLASPEPFAGIDPRALGAIVHTAATTAFGVARDEAWRVNVEGTRKVLELARRCPRLDACVLASTLYAAGLREGPLEEDAFDRPEAFANHYEASKWEMERMAREDFGDVPWIVARIGTLAAADASGAVVQDNALGNTLRLFLHGLLPVMAGDSATSIYTTTTEFAALACSRLPVREHAHGFFHVSDAWPDALTIGEAVAVAGARFGMAARRVAMPRFCDLESFRALADGARRFSPVMDAALSSIAPFAAQLYCAKRVGNTRLRAALDWLDPPCMRDVLARVCDRLAARGAAA